MAEGRNGTQYADARERVLSGWRGHGDAAEVVADDVPTGCSGAGGRPVDGPAGSAEMVSVEEEVAVVVEQVNAMPGQGVTSMFNFGQTFGALKGICAALELPIFFVRPSKWKKHFELINSSKDASRTKAIEMYPKLSNQLSKKKDVNKSDAILIARFFSETRLIEEN